MLSKIKLTASGNSKRLNKVLFSYNYTLATSPKDIIEDIINATESLTGVTYRADLIDLGVVDPIIIEYVDKKAGKIIDDLVSRANNRFWGVNQNNEFFVSEYNEWKIDKYLYNMGNSIYSESEFSKDYSKVKATKYTTYKKDPTGSGQIRVGTVGGVGNVSYRTHRAFTKLRKHRALRKYRTHRAFTKHRALRNTK